MNTDVIEIVGYRFCGGMGGIIFNIGNNRYRAYWVDESLQDYEYSSDYLGPIFDKEAANHLPIEWWSID